MKKSGQCRTTPDKNHRPFNHPRDGAPEISQEFQERIVFLFRDLVRAILGQPLLRLGLAEAVRRRTQFFLHFRHGKGFQIVLGSGLGPLGSGSGDFASALSAVGVMMAFFCYFCPTGPGVVMRSDYSHPSPADPCPWQPFSPRYLWALAYSLGDAPLPVADFRQVLAVLVDVVLVLDELVPHHLLQIRPLGA